MGSESCCRSDTCAFAHTDAAEGDSNWSAAFHSDSLMLIACDGAISGKGVVQVEGN